MASPMLEQGAIDGARGILINITGSSALKLSEVNAASSLIESSAHEDANIIFGAVLDERMGDEVKITVIATGFKDQMPERRARMLSVEDAPVISVPVVAQDNWFREPAVRESVAAVAVAPAQAVKSAPVAAPERVYIPEPEPEPELVMAHAEPPRPRFMSEELEEEDIVTVQRPAAVYTTPQAETAISMHMDEMSFDEPAAVSPKFAEMAEPTAHAVSPNGSAVRYAAAMEERRPMPAGGLFEENVDTERDLEVPTFMRRSPLF